MKLGVVGSRTFKDYSYLTRILKYYDCSMIVSGGAEGADKLARKYALEYNIPYKEFPALWKLYGKSAGAKRNQQIVDYADEIVAFWNKISKGTAITVEMAVKCGKPVAIYWPTFDDLLTEIGENNVG